MYIYLVTIVAAWIVSQGSKYIIMAVRHRNISSFRHLYLSGNMPSVHTAAVVSLATVVGLREGFESAVFGVAVLLAGIVMYDAVMVRRSSGEQGIAIQQLIREQKSSVSTPRAAKGHTPVEVSVGALVGLAVGLVVYIATH